MHIPQPGDIYMFTTAMRTAGQFDYDKGDLLTLVRLTEETPFGYKSKIGNWVVKCKEKTSVWSSIWYLIEQGNIVCVGSNVV